MSGMCVCEAEFGHRSLLTRDPSDGDSVEGCPMPGPGGFPGGAKLEGLLRAYHAGSDRGELRALLVEAWGPSPAMTIHPLRDNGDDIYRQHEEHARQAITHGLLGASDLRGFAARESQPPINIRDAQAADELADLARGPRL